MLQEDKVQTPYGIFSGVKSLSRTPDGRISDMRLNEKNVIMTHAGDLIPFYGEETPRRKHKASVSFHKNGMIKAVALEERQEIDTPIGEFPAEFVTFYDTGEIRRVFPLDGKISGYWSQEDERALNIPFKFEFDFASFSAILVSICFYKSGSIKSITLFPGELIDITAPCIGKVSVRNGFSLYESGRLCSLEPAVPVPVKTPIGEILAYDTGAVGINADSNSLRFDEEGRVTGLAASANRIAVREKGGAIHFFAPGEILNPLDGETKLTVALKIEFDYCAGRVTIVEAEGASASFAFDDSYIIYRSEISACTGSDCSSCSLCNHK